MRFHTFGLIIPLCAVSVQAQRANTLPIHNAPVRTLVEVPGTRIDGNVFPSGSPNRVYYESGDSLYVLDFSTKASTNVATGEMWNIDVARTNDRMVFGRNREDGKISNVWTMALDPRTGLAASPARRLALTPGDQPRISPDGKLVAFAAYDSSDWGATQHVAIISVDGGTERVLARLNRGVGRIDWSADGRSLYVLAMMNPPAKWTGVVTDLRWLLRIAVADGAVDTLPLKTVGLEPGVAPDGRFVALTEDGSMSNFVLTDLRGVPQARFSVPTPGHIGWVWRPLWRDAHSLVGGGSEVKAALQIVDLATGKSREVVPAGLSVEGPYWSADGMSLAMFATVQGRRVLLVVEAASGKRREYSSGVVQPCCMYDRSYDLQWSPDGKAIAFHGGYRDPLRVIDLTTGNMHEIGPKSTLIGDYRWRSDSRALQFTTSTTPVANRVIHETTLSGEDRVLYDGVPSGNGVAGMRTDTTAVYNSNVGVYIVNVRTRKTTQLRPNDSPWIEGNRRGTAFVTRDFVNAQEINVVQADGSHATAKLSFSLPISPPYHQGSLALLPDGRVLLIGRAQGDKQTVYTVEPKTGESKRLFETPQQLGHTLLDVSPDGKFLAYNMGVVSSVIVQVDLSSFLPSAPAPKH